MLLVRLALMISLFIRQSLKLVNYVKVGTLIGLTNDKLTFEKDVIEERYELMFLYSTTFYLCAAIRQ